MKTQTPKIRQDHLEAFFHRIIGVWERMDKDHQWMYFEILNAIEDVERGTDYPRREHERVKKEQALLEKYGLCEVKRGEL